ncbi:hypothetical protein C8Q75DRAFT_807375 [Abortiporus biennis]|nr:hypothetical protein C8Q75DRAFT_807375 [Abortiporus biennis]
MSTTQSSEPSPTAAQKSHSIATFAGAVGGSVGLLAVLALSLAFSIYRRRLHAKRRDRRSREARAHGQHGSVTSFGADSFHTNASEDGPPMQGPAPFVPRYFPGTVPAAPPPYSPSAAQTSEVTTSLLSASPTHSPSGAIAWPTHRLGYTVVPTSSNDASYAEHPPPTPPMTDRDLEDGYGYFAPPPPFGVAISTPVPAILAGLSNLFGSASSSTPAPSDAEAPTSSSNTELDLPSSPEPQRPHFHIPLLSSHSRRPSRSSLASHASSRRSNSRSHIPYTRLPASSPEAGPSNRSRPTSLASSDVPPSIPPPQEVLQAELDAQTRHDDDGSRT